MSRVLMLAAGAAGAAALLFAGVAPAQADTAPVTTCNNWHLQDGHNTPLCVTVSGTSVSLTGQIALAGPPSPGTPWPPAPEQTSTTLSADVVGGGNLGTAQQNVVFQASTLTIGPLNVTAACGTTVHASFSISTYPWFNTPTTVDVPINC
ncbi:hypothetical protein ACFYNO_37250 [Kitasatospora sp. NPDC006697]|uniref:hypothetical protein n=1 Tax=Kitasatospora sp. NPDC006697 TaxID=3364020 RepID=UPI0036D0E3CD